MLTDDAVDTLRVAIVKQAAKDYMTAYGRVKRLEKERERLRNRSIDEDLKTARAKLDVEKKFFYSEWYHILMNIEPDTLLKLLEAEIDKKQKFI